MTLLLRPYRSTVPLRDPQDRSRYWYALLWQQAPQRRYTPEEAQAIVEANWHMSSKELLKGAIY